MGQGLGKLAILGAGNIGRRHGTFYLERGWDVAYVDIAAHMTDTVGFEQAMHKADGVLICTPPDLHLQGLMAALPYGIPIFVEKPLGTNATMARSLVEEAARRKIPIQVGYVWRWDPEWQEFRANNLMHGIAWVTARYAQSLHRRERTQETKISPWVFALSPEWEMSHIVDLVLALGVDPTLVAVTRPSENLLAILLPRAVIMIDYVVDDTIGFVEVTTHDGRHSRWDRTAKNLRTFYAAELLHFERVVDRTADPFPDGADALRTVDLLDRVRDYSVPHGVEAGALESVETARPGDVV